MIPRRLIIKGLYSYQEQQEIDFSRLLQSRIFGIFGSTGSGKSSLVEAISMALYGESGRLNARDNRQYNMMNLKSNELLIDFEFITGSPQMAYRVVVNARRNSKNFSNITKWDRRAFEWLNDSWSPIELESLEQIIGLSSENFHRTIIIPQGKFQEFLELTGAERTRMLRELFDLGKYELGYKLVSIEKRNEAERNHVLGQLAGIESYTNEAFVALNDEVITVESKIKLLEDSRISLQTDESILAASGQIHHQLKEAVNGYNELFSRSEEMEALSVKIAQHRLCKKYFDNPITALKRIEKVRIELQSELKQFNKEKSDWLNKLIVLKESMQGAHSVVLQIPDLNEEIRSISLIFEMRKAEEELQSKEEARKKGLTFVNEKREELEKANEAFRRLKSEREMTLTGVLSAEETVGLNKWFLEYSNILQRVKEAESRRAELSIRLTGFIQQYTETVKVFKVELSHNEEDDEKFRLLTGQFENRIKNDEELADKLKKSKHLAEFANTLEDGKACPLCGSDHHPEIYNNEAVFGQLKELEKDINVARAGLKTLESAMTAAARIRERIKENSTDLQLLDREIENLRIKEASLFKMKPKEIGFDEIANLIDKSTEAIRHVEKEIDPAIKQLEVQIGNLQNILEKSRQRFEELDKDIGRLSERVNILALQAGADLTGRYQNWPAEDLPKQIEKIESDIKKSTLEFETLNSRIAEANAEVQKLEGIIFGMDSRKEELDKERKETDSLIAELLKNHVFENIEMVETILNDAFDVDAASGNWHQWHTRLDAALLIKNQLSKLAETSPYDVVQHETVKVQLSDTITALESIRQQRAVLRKQLEDFSNKLEERKKLQLEFERLQSRFDNIKVLKSMFTASGFVNYASSVYLHSLVNAANERFFQLSGRSLRIELSDDNSFVVRDYLNNGHLRSIKTLSGGQKFQASLSLALALADSLQQQRQAEENFFFLDEGFGSLDKESLAVVYDTLKALRRENRIVGVISHVEDLQQEIESHIRVVNDGELGSKIQIHY